MLSTCVSYALVLLVNFLETSLSSHTLLSPLASIRAPMTKTDLLLKLCKL